MALMNKKFKNKEAEALVATIRSAMEQADHYDLGWTTRHVDLPKCIPMDHGKWTVDPKQLERFETIVHLLVCALFGVDSDGDSPIKFVFIDRTRESTQLPIMSVRQLELGERNENKIMGALVAAQANAQAAAKDADRLLGQLERALRKNTLDRAIRKAAEGHEPCKQSGFVRVSYDESEKWMEGNPRYRHEMPTGRIFCECQKARLEAEEAAEKRTDEDEKGED